MNFVVVATRAEATIKSEKAMWKYAVNLTRISISESTAKIHGFTPAEAKTIIKLVKESKPKELAEHLKKQGYVDKVVNSLVKKHMIRKYKDVVKIKSIEFHEGQDEIGSIEKINDTLEQLQGLIQIKKPIKINFDSESGSDFQGDTINLNATGRVPIELSLAKELGRCYSQQIVPDWAELDSVFYVNNLAVSNYYMKDYKTSTVNERRNFVNEMEKKKGDFLCSVTLGNFKFKQKAYLKFKKQSSAGNHLFDLIKRHPYNDEPDCTNRRIWKQSMFVRCIEQVVKEKMNLQQPTTFEGKIGVKQITKDFDKLGYDGGNATPEMKKLALKYDKAKSLSTKQKRAWSKEITKATLALLKTYK